jgi:hypothetical protein
MFEWDADKGQENIAKHGVDFVRAAMIFQNPVIAAIDARKQYGETRYRALGHIEDESYVVIYAWRGKTCRLISAWKAGENGKKRYHAILSGRA